VLRHELSTSARCASVSPHTAVEVWTSCRTGRLGHIRPTTAHAIGGTAELALRYSQHHLSTYRRARLLQVATTGRTGSLSMGNAAASAGAAGPPPGLRAGPEQADAIRTTLSGDYGPGRSSGHRRCFRRSRSTFQGLRAGRASRRTTMEYTAASGRHDHATFRGAGRASVRTRSQHYIRRGTGRVSP
jgi:hypothetical protein